MCDPYLNRYRDIPPNGAGGGIFASFRYSFRQDADSYVISDVAIEYVDVDVRLKYGDQRSNDSRDIRGADFVSNDRT